MALNGRDDMFLTDGTTDDFMPPSDNMESHDEPEHDDHMTSGTNTPPPGQTANQELGEEGEKEEEERDGEGNKDVEDEEKTDKEDDHVGEGKEPDNEEDGDIGGKEGDEGRIKDVDDKEEGDGVENKDDLEGKERDVERGSKVEELGRERDVERGRKKTWVTQTSHGVWTKTSDQPAHWRPVLLAILLLILAGGAAIIAYLLLQPAKVTFLMMCEAPQGEHGDITISQLCWLDDVTLVAVRHNEQQVMKLNINMEDKSCTSTILDSGYHPTGLSCSPDGQIYVLRNNSVMIYNGEGEGEEWVPEGVSSPHTVAVNKDRIILGLNHRGPVSVYNTERELLDQVSVAGDQGALEYTHLTEDGVLLASTWMDGHHLIIHDLEENVTVVTGGEGEGNGYLQAPYDVRPGPNGTILVCDSENHRVSVFSADGDFLYHLLYEGSRGGKPYALSVRPRPDKPSLMALVLYPENGTRIYSITP